MRQVGPKKAGVIVNPRAGRGQGSGLVLAELLAGTEVELCVLNRFEDVIGALEDFRHKGVNVIYISSGDGTIQGIQTLLAESVPFDIQPLLCLLPNGTTNMTAGEIGYRVRSPKQQARFILEADFFSRVTRKTLRIVNPADGKVRHGMFLGAGAVAAATRYCQTAFNDRGVAGHAATFATLVALILKHLVSDRTVDANRVDRPYHIDLQVDRNEICAGDQLLAIFSTLNKLILGSRPFWNVGAGAIQYSVIPHPVPNPLRWTLPLLYGTNKRRVPAGALSGSGSVININCAYEYVLDGEFFFPPESGPLIVEEGCSFEYVVG